MVCSPVVAAARILIVLSIILIAVDCTAAIPSAASNRAAAEQRRAGAEEDRGTAHGRALPTVVVFRANNTLKTCYRNPVLLRAPNGDLLCFVEERYRGAAWTPSNTSGDHSCPDNYLGEKGGHNLGFARSADNGATWSPITRLAGDLDNLRNGPTDYTNNAAVVATTTLPGGGGTRRRIVWQFGTQNNPSRAQHGRLLQRHSDDSGKTWSWPPRDVSAAAAAVGLPGATPGPGQGVQLTGPSGRLVFCAWGNTATTPFGSKGWNRAANFANTLLYSDDAGETWRATAPVGGRGWNECFLAQLNATTLLEVSRRTNPDASVAPSRAYPAHTYGNMLWDAGGAPDGPPRNLTAVATLGAPGAIKTPVCEAALLAVGGALFLSHPQSDTARTNLTIQRSVDGGDTWPRSVLVSGADSGAGYSSLVAGVGDDGRSLGIAFNQWPTQHPKDSDDGPGTYIRFATVPLSAFDSPD